MTPYEQAQQAAAVLAEKTGVDHHDVALVLGSGWLPAAEMLGEAQAEIDVSELPGFCTMKTKSLGAVLAKRYGVEAAQELVPWHPTLGDVDSRAALKDYQATKRLNKKLWESGPAPD